MRKRVVVTGTGCICPVGSDTETSWSNIRAGKSGIGPITLFDASEFQTRIAGEVKDFDPVALFGSKEARRMDRYTQFAATAAQEALVNAGLTAPNINGDRIGVFMGTGIGGVGTLLKEHENLLAKGPRRVSPFLVPMMLPDSASGQIAILFGLRGPNLSVVSACASGTNAIGEAAETIRRGAADIMLAGGAEAAILPTIMAGFGVMGAISTRNEDPQAASRPFDKNRDGFVAGEGAGALILEEYDHAKSRNAPILGEVLGYGITNDAYHITAPSETGAGASLCMQMALADAGLRVDQIDYLNAHGTSTPLNDRSETAAVKTVLGEAAYDTPISSTKSMTGHLLGAAGAIEAIFCLKAIQEGFLPPTINYETRDPECDLDYVPNRARAASVQRVMSNSFGFGGHNATLILGAVNGQP